MFNDNVDIVHFTSFGNITIYIRYHSLPKPYYSIGIQESHIYNDKKLVNISSTELYGKYIFYYMDTVVIIRVIKL